MTFWIASFSGLAIAYFLGSIPTGYLAGRFLKGVDLRELGSGSTGATNVLRTLGQGPFWAVLAIDILKGGAAVFFARWFYPWLAALPTVAVPSSLAGVAWTPWAVALAGLAALVGHARPIWLNFQGGKSVAAGLGLLIAMAWPVGLFSLLAFGIVLAISRIMSLSSMVAALTAIALVCVLDQPLPYRLLVILGGAYVIVRHRANIRRLLAGTEPRLGQGGAAGRGV